MVQHRGTEDTERNDAVVSRQIIGAAVEVHRSLGPGLLESSYSRCLWHELTLRGLSYEREIPLPLSCKGIEVETAYRIDLIVEEKVLVEVKSLAKLDPIHKAQILTYLRLTKLRVGLLINFNVERLVDGVRRVVNGY